MISIRRLVAGILVSGWTLILCDAGRAQMPVEAQAGPSTSRGDWEQRVLRGSATNAQQAVMPRRTAWSPHRYNPVRPAAVFAEDASAQAELTLDPAPNAQPAPRVTDDTMIMQEGSPEVIPPGPAVGVNGPSMAGDSSCSDCGNREGTYGGWCEDGCDACVDDCGDGWYGCGPDCGLLEQVLNHVVSHDVAVFAGIQGFKGPRDEGRNGNFGFHEGINYGAPTGLLDVGYQVGAQVVHSNLIGDQVFDSSHANRTQFFFTAGLFRRALCGGFQSGVVFDWQHDKYYGTADIKQIRSETGYVFSGGRREIGYFGAYGTGGDNLILLDRTTIGLEPTDMFAFFYRRHFDEGGDGRLWAGFSGGGDGLLGGAFRVPIGSSLALENKFNFLVPKQGRNSGGSIEESWGLTMHLVWYPGRPARCVDSSPYRPLLNVADNTLFFTDRAIVQSSTGQ